MHGTRAEIIYEPDSTDEPSIKEVNLCQMYLLHVKADRMLRTLITHELEAFRIGIMEWLLLGIVAEAPEEGMSLSEIARRLDVSQPQVTALMGEVTKQKLVRQKIQRHDRRSRHVMLSSRGERLVKHAETAMSDAMQEWLRTISQKQLETYQTVIEHFSLQKVE